MTNDLNHFEIFLTDPAPIFTGRTDIYTKNHRTVRQLLKKAGFDGNFRRIYCNYAGFLLYCWCGIRRREFETILTKNKTTEEYLL